MARILLLTNTLGASAEVAPSLALLQHQVRILPIEASALVDAPDLGGRRVGQVGDRVFARVELLRPRQQVAFDHDAEHAVRAG